MSQQPSEPRKNHAETGSSISVSTYPHPSTRPLSAVFWWFAGLFGIRRPQPATAPDGDAELTALVHTIALLHEAVILIDLLESSHADKWPTLAQTSVGPLLTGELRQEYLEIGAHLREAAARMARGERFDESARDMERETVQLLRNFYRLYDVAERELEEGRIQ